MARIPRYAGSRGVQAPQHPIGPVMAEAAGYNALGQGLQDFGAGLLARDRKNAYEAKQAAEEAERVKLRVDTDIARVHVARALSNLRERLTTEELTLKNTIGPGAEGYTPSLMKTYDGLAEELITGAPNDIAKQALTERTAEIRGTYFDQALTYESSVAQAQREKDVFDTVNRSGNYLRTHPAQFEVVLAEIEGALEGIKNQQDPVTEQKQSWQLKNVLATASIEGEIAVAPGFAQKKLKSGYWDNYITPDQKNSFLKSTEAKKETNNAVQNYLVGRDIKNHLVMVETTGQGIPGMSGARIAALTGNPVAGLQFDDADAAARQVYAITSQLDQNLTPEQTQRLAAQVAPNKAARPETYARDAEMYGRVLKAIGDDRRSLITDPAAWANKNGQIAVLAGSVGTVTATEQSIIVQKRGGLPANQTRVLTKDGAKQTAAVLQAQTPKEALFGLNSLQQEYGKFFPKVMTELVAGGLSTDYMVIHNVMQVDPQTAALLSETTKVKKESITSQFTASGFGPYSSVEATVNGMFRDFEKAATYVYPNRRDTIDNTKDLFARTAANLVLSGRKKNVQDATAYLYDRSFGGIISNRTYYLPNRLQDGTPLDTKRATIQLEDALSSRAWQEQRKLSTNLTLPLGSFGNSRMEADHYLIKSSGIWVNSADGQSLELWLERKTGFVRIYETIDGKSVPVSVSLEDVQAGKIAPPPRTAPHPQSRNF